MAAFRGAIEVGAHAIEADLHLSKDGVVVLSHVCHSIYRYNRGGVFDPSRVFEPTIFTGCNSEAMLRQASQDCRLRLGLLKYALNFA